MAASMTPRIRRTAENTQFTYNLSRRISDVQTYPTPSPQGATILIYGHDSGVTVVWRGGRRFKDGGATAATASNNKNKDKKQNGSVDADSIMVIDSDSDSDDDGMPTKTKQQQQQQQQSAGNKRRVDKPEFEDEADTTPYAEIVQTLDLTFGTAVLNIAVHPGSMRPGQQDGDDISNDYGKNSKNMVFAVSCVTNDVYLVSLPLTPPSHEAKARPELRSDLLSGKAGSGAWGETVTLLGGQTRPSDGIALQIVPPSPPSADADVEGDEVAVTRPSRAIVASRSREASGVLRLWDLPLYDDDDDGERGGDEGSARPRRVFEPFQTEFLPAPLTAMSFNPNPSTTQLLVVSAPHAVRIYDFAVPSLPPDPDATGPLPAQGSWLLSLYQPFARSSTARKPVVDAAWIAHGRAIFALMADGMWQIWDVDGVGARVSGSAATASGKLRTGVRGAALTAFSVSGFVEGTSSLRAVAAAGAQARDTAVTGDFVPMTPHTRRQAAASITSSAASAADRLATMHGGIAVAPAPSSSSPSSSSPSSAGALPDENLVLWLGDHEHVAVIMGVSRFWESQVNRPSLAADSSAVLFGAPKDQPARMLKLQDLSTGLLGERCCGVTLLPGTAASTTSTAAGTAGTSAAQQNQQLEIAVRGETRLVIVRPGEDGAGKKIGGLAAANSRGRRLLAYNRSEAIIVNGGAGPDAASAAAGGKPRAPSNPFNLSTIRGAASLRQRGTGAGLRDGSPSQQRQQSKTVGAVAGAGAGAGVRPSVVGFDFTGTLDAAADVTGGDDARRNVDAEMLDIMGIDKALESMQGGAIPDDG